MSLLTSAGYSVFRSFKYNNLEQNVYALDKPFFQTCSFRVGRVNTMKIDTDYSEPLPSLCLSCNQNEENEFRFLFKCPAYKDKRTRSLPFCFSLIPQDYFMNCFSSAERGSHY